jgi:hypothetical protein
VTAIAVRRTRRTVIGAAMALGLFVLASAMFVVGVVTLSNSQEGEAVGVDARPRVQLPVTPNAALALTDEAGRLASLVVMTLLPEGQGGSIVTVPVNADVTAGFGPEPLSMASVFSTVDLDGFVGSVEDMLAITIQRADVVTAPELASMLPEVETVRLVLPADVVDTAPGGGQIAEAGPQSFTITELADILGAIDDDAPIDVSHPNDVAVWQALAQTAPAAVASEPIPFDDLGRPIPPETVDELVARLWQGQISVRDLATIADVEVGTAGASDVVLIDRRDSTLVFSQVSPGLVSTPNTGLTARIVANFTDEQIAAADPLYASSSDVAVELIGRLLFLTGNVVSVDTAPTGAPAVTIIEVADVRQLQDTIGAAGSLFGPAEVRVAETVIEGVDIEITLGMSYLERELARAASVARPTTVPDTSVLSPGSPAGTSSSDVPATVAGDG